MGASKEKLVVMGLAVIRNPSKPLSTNNNYPIPLSLRPPLSIHVLRLSALRRSDKNHGHGHTNTTFVASARSAFSATSG